jgi:repressor LexA
VAHTPPGETRERVYQFVRRRILEGNPPTIREVQAAMGFRAVESARSHLNALVAEGRLAKEPGRSRGYALPARLAGSRNRREPPLALVPLVGQVQAGDLNLALETPEGHLPVQTRHPADQLFALIVEGRSMMGAGILPGDLVIVRRQPTAQNGEVVVALVGDEATVKTLRIRRGRVELHPANRRFKTILPDPQDLRILGKVIEVRRRLE